MWLNRLLLVSQPCHLSLSSFWGRYTSREIVSHYNQSWRRLVNAYAVEAVMVLFQVKLCDPHLSAFGVRYDKSAIHVTFIFNYYTQHNLTNIDSVKCTKHMKK